MKKKLIAAFACFALALGIAGCAGGNTSKGSEVQYADDTAVATIASGWEKRQDVLEDIDATLSDVKYGEALQEGIQAEIDTDSDLKEAKFKDSELQEKVISYINILNDQYELAGEWNSTDIDFYDKWQKIYDERSTMLKDFVDNYDMTVDDKYADSFKELMVNGKSAQAKNDQEEAINALAASANWEYVDDGYGNITCTAIIENTSDYDFENVGFVLNCYDADGVKTENYVGADNWRKGEKAKFETYLSAVPSSIETVVDYYTVVDE